VRLLREFDNVQDDQIDDWVKLCREVASYFCWWLDDPTFRSVDENDVPDFPEDEDDETHLRNY
jgi:hypothetical protein